MTGHAHVAIGTRRVRAGKQTRVWVGRCLQRHGLQAVVADPSQFELRDGAHWHGETRADMVFNRLTDFSLDTAPSAALREAYLQRAVVLTFERPAAASRRSTARWRSATKP